MALRTVFAFAAALLLPAVALAASTAAPSSTGAGAVTGVWVTPHGKSHIRIYRGESGHFEGKIIWLKQPNYPAKFHDKALAGKPKIDRHNPHKSLRDRPIQGLNILHGFRYLPKHHAWGKGKCYDPENGKNYSCRMWLIDGGKKLKLRGYLWIFHKTQTWRRYSPPAASARAPAAASASDRSR